MLHHYNYMDLKRGDKTGGITSSKSHLPRQQQT